MNKHQAITTARPGRQRLIRARRRATYWGGLGALAGLAAGLHVVWNTLAADWEMLATSEPGTLADTLLSVLVFDGLYVGLVLVVIASLFLTGAGLLGAVAGFALPRKISPVIDILPLGVTFAIVGKAIGLVDFFEGVPLGGFLMLGSYFVFHALFGAPLWTRLPWGLSFSESGTRVIDLPRDRLRLRLLPEMSIWQEPADLAFRRFDGPLPKGWETIETRELGNDCYQIDEVASKRGFRQMLYRLEDDEGGGTRLSVEMTLNGLSPLAFVELWTRPYCEDYLDHLDARLAGREDPSVYGALVGKLAEKAAPPSPEAQPA